MAIQEPLFDRRMFLAGAAALTALVSARSAGATHHKHAGHAGHGTNHPELLKAALDCVGRGEDCLAHCLADFRSGNTELAVCASRVEEMIPVCATLSRLASLDSSHLASYAAVCAEICKSCESACREHEDKHAVCRACADSCAACIKQCEALQTAA